MLSLPFSASRRYGTADYRLYSNDMKEGAGRRHLMLSALRNGLRKNELFMLYQPQYNIQSEELVSVEALVRWQSKELGGMISPGDFIPLAEESDLVALLGYHILEQVFQQISHWLNDGVYIPKVAINISPRHLIQPDFIENLQHLANKYQIDAQQVELEITETSLLDNPELALSVLTRLKALGFSLAIDDFGSGYSSFQYLKVMPINKLKIDRMFISELEHSKSDQAIIQSLVAIAQNLGFSLLAEGVETLGQLAILKREQVDLVQGFLYAKPLSAKDLADETKDSELSDRAFIS